MLIWVDSREKENSEVIEYFEKNGISYFPHTEKCGLYAGDYLDIHSGKVVIDLKKDLVEVAGNLTNQHERFKREIFRATQEMKCRFVVLIREPLKSLEDVRFWQSPKFKNGKPLTNIVGMTLYRIMKTMEKKYDVIWRFCSRENAGEKIVEIFEKSKLLKE